MPRPDDSLIGEIRAEMARQRLTYGDLSQLTDCRLSPTALSRRFAGRLDFSVIEVLAICDALGVTFAEIARRAEGRAA